MADGYNSMLGQPPKKKFNFGELISGLVQGAANATRATNPYEGALLGAAGGIDYFNQDAMRQAYIENLLQDNLRSQQGLDLQNRGFEQNLREYEEVDKPYKQALTEMYGQRYNPSPEELEYDTTKKREELRKLRLENRIKAREAKFGKSPLTTVNVGAAETEEQKGMGRLRAENYQNIQKDADIARDNIDIFNELESLMSKTTTGAFEPFKTNIASYAQSLGVPVSDKWSANQTIEAISNKLTIMARKVGEGQMLAGQISDADREFLKRSVPELGKLPGANKMLIDWNKKLAQRKIESAQFAEEYYNKNGTMKGFIEARKEWANKNPLFANVSNTHVMPDGSTMSNTEMKTQETNQKGNALQELFELAQQGDQEAIQYFKSKGIK